MSRLCHSKPSWKSPLWGATRASSWSHRLWCKRLPRFTMLWPMDYINYLATPSQIPRSSAKVSCVRAAFEFCAKFNLAPIWINECVCTVLSIDRYELLLTWIDPWIRLAWIKTFVSISTKPYNNRCLATGQGSGKFQERVLHLRRAAHRVQMLHIGLHRPDKIWSAANQNLTKWVASESTRVQFQTAECPTLYSLCGKSHPIIRSSGHPLPVVEVASRSAKIFALAPSSHHWGFWHQKRSLRSFRIRSRVSLELSDRHSRKEAFGCENPSQHCLEPI